MKRSSKMATNGNIWKIKRYNHSIKLVWSFKKFLLEKFSFTLFLKGINCCYITGEERRIQSTLSGTIVDEISAAPAGPADAGQLQDYQIPEKQLAWDSPGKRFETGSSRTQLVPAVQPLCPIGSERRGVLCCFIDDANRDFLVHGWVSEPGPASRQEIL